MTVTVNNLMRRLRSGFGGIVPPVCDEAANEIERMTAEIEHARKLLPALREFLWAAVCWNDHNFRERTLAMKCRDLCRELGISNVEDANDLLAAFDQQEMEGDES